MKYSFLIISQLILVLNIYAQVQQEWVARYNGVNNYFGDWAYGIAMDSTGNVFVVGSAGSNTQQDIAILKYSTSGTLMWVKNYAGNNESQDNGYDIAIDRNQNVYAIGRSYDMLGMEIVLLKYDNNGNFLWESRDTGSAYETMSMILFDNNDNIYDFGLRNDGININKISSTGSVLWKRILLPSEGMSCLFSDAVIDDLGNLFVGGNVEIDTSIYRFVVYKISSNGDILWYRIFNRPISNLCDLEQIKLFNSQYLYIAGTVERDSTGKDYFTVKLDQNGDSIWGDFYNSNGVSNDFVHTLEVDENQNVYIAGHTWESVNQSTTRRNHIVKYNAEGTYIWQKDINFENSIILINKSIYKNSFFYFTGSIISNSQDYFTFKVDSEGSLVWKQTYNGTANAWDNSRDIVVDNNSSIFITGTSRGTGEDFLTIKYSQPIGIDPVSSEIPHKFTLHQNYPNPFNPSTKIKFELPAAGNVTIRIFDVLGREVSMLVNEFMKQGVYETDFNSADLPSGVYFYKLIAGNFTATKKLIILK